MKAIILLFLFSSKILSAQNNFNFPAKFVEISELKTENVVNQYSHFNFSNVWLKADNSIVYGTIGDDHQRIYIKLLSVKKNPADSKEYVVAGKSKVKNVIRNFQGTILLKEILEVKNLHFGVDDEYANKGIKAEGILIADYEFKEYENQSGTGLFRGKLFSKWYLNDKNKMMYDDIAINSDRYFNNAFVGKRESFKTKKKKNCNWGDYRIPNAAKDFDIGVGEFNVSKKYWDKGWSEIGLKNHLLKQDIKFNKNLEKQKKWWE